MREATGLITTVESIRNCVYIIRGQQVMLDYDLATIYGYEVKRLNEQVKRNILNAIDTYDYTYAINSEGYITSIITVANEYYGGNTTRTKNYTWVCP